MSALQIRAPRQERLSLEGQCHSPVRTEPAPRGLGVPKSLGGINSVNSVVECKPRNKKYFYIKYSIKLSCHVNTVILGKDVRPGHPKMATGQSLLREPETRAAASAPPLSAGAFGQGVRAPPGSDSAHAPFLPRRVGPGRPCTFPRAPAGAVHFRARLGGTPWTPRGRAPWSRWRGSGLSCRGRGRRAAGRRSLAGVRARVRGAAASGVRR